MDVDAIWNGLGSAAFFVAATPVLLGAGLPLSKLWLTSEDDVRNRSTALSEILNESVAKCLDRLLTKAIELEQGTWRGEPPRQPDLLADFTKELFRVFFIRQRLGQIQLSVKRWHEVLFVTGAAGIVLVLAAVPLASWRPIIALGAIFVIFLQILVVFRVRAVVLKLSEHETAT